MIIEEIKSPIALLLDEKYLKKLREKFKEEATDMSTTCAVIGDLHVKMNNIEESKKLLQKCLNVIIESKVKFVVILGDLLHTNETVKVQPHNVIEEFMRKLNAMGIHTFVIIGNHDHINNSQFHTENHIFTPFKMWQHVTVVDSTVIAFINSHSVVFTPYVPVGKFAESLNTLTTINEMWENASCIFAHQEIKGCKLTETVESTEGDEWSDTYPPIVSGHIHKSQKVGKNIYYPGSPMSHSRNDTDDKFIWIINFDHKDDKSNEGYPFFHIEKINTNTRKKVYERCTDVESLKNINTEQYANCDLTIKITVKPEEFKALKTTKIYKDLTEGGVTIVPHYKEQSELCDKSINTSNKNTAKSIKPHKKFSEILQENIKLEDKATQKLFKKLCLTAD